MPTFFCVSDIHGFYDEFIDALNKSGFDSDNQDHWLVCCGDCFDRGKQPLEVLGFLSSLDRKILVKGNHEVLLENMIMRGYPRLHDKHNGTAETVLAMTGLGAGDFKLACDETYRLTKDFIGSMVPYFETKHYVFVHAFVPVTFENERHAMANCVEHNFVRRNWRGAKPDAWEKAMWLNPMLLVKKGSYVNKKTLVAGHWHCSYGHSADSRGEKPEFGCGADFSPYYTEGLIAIDACTASSGSVNVVKIIDEFM